MRIINPELLKAFHLPGPCELCGRMCKEREPHHVIAKGMGGGRRLDSVYNMVAVGRGHACPCHSTFADSIKGSTASWGAIARRQGCTPDEALAAMWFILYQLDKDDSPEKIDSKIESSLAVATRAIVIKELEAARIVYRMGP